MSLAYPPAQGCDRALNAWCSTHCPHAQIHGPLYARLDGALGSAARHAWRCYAASTLDAFAQRYVSGTTYCTRDPPLRKVLQACLASAEAEIAATAEPVSVVVDEQGRTRTATASSTAGASGYRETVEVRATSHISPLPRAPTLLEPGPRFYDVNAAVRVGIVVAHCHEVMRWLREVQRGLRAGAGALELRLELHVYEKCGNRSEDAWTRLGWQHERRTYLANRGEECFAYLTYLTDLYALLPDVVLFFQVGRDE